MPRVRFISTVGIVLLALAAMGQPGTAGSVSAANGSNSPGAEVSGAAGAFEGSDIQGTKFVRQAAGMLRLNGRPFRFGGANNYYLMYKSQKMVGNLLSTAAANNLDVLRIWGSLEIGNQDGSNSINGKSDGVYFQYWNGSAPAYNDGADGLQHLDYVIYRAGQLGIRLVIPFVNNWNAFGGMDQYVRWRGGQYHDQFYSDPAIRAWYKSWISHLLTRTNMYTGVQYRNDPTIMMWELANEPRCKSAGAYPQSSLCTTQTLTTWADDVSGFVKGVDPHHLVSTGDEGFYCIPGAADWTENCGEGIDTLALTRLENIDVMSLHLYPDSWGKDAAWGTRWITHHIQDAQASHKAVMLGEFGLQDKSIRNPVYKQWTDAVYSNGGSGALAWMLADKQEDGTYYSDYDGFTVYCPSPVCITLSNFALEMAGHAPSFPPVADNDTVTTPFDTPATLTPLSNDTTYGDVALVKESIDLDPATAGPQSTQTIVGKGTFVLQTDGTVTFTPVAGFSGKVTSAYTVQDSLGRTSNPANLIVTVKPSPTQPIMLFSFEGGTEGWGAGNWADNAGAGTVAQSADFHTDGSYSLQINGAKGGWFGLDFDTPADLTGKTHLKLDLKTGAAGTSNAVVLKVGDSYTWCQLAGWGWVNPFTTTTIDVDLTQAPACAQDLSKVRGMYVWFSSGTFFMDAIRAE